MKTGEWILLTCLVCPFFCGCDYVIELYPSQCTGSDCSSDCDVQGSGKCIPDELNIQRCNDDESSCGIGQTCSDGKCVCINENSILCDGICVDVTQSSQHCGACHQACGAGMTCFSGECRCEQGDAALCDGVCVDLQSDARHCGSCDAFCESDEECRSGVCECRGEGRARCDGQCVDLYSSANHCGACGHSCGMDEICGEGECRCRDAGLTACGGTCTDVRKDNENCGSCGHACGEQQICIDGECSCTNEDTPILCGETCVNLYNNLDHCLACGNSCGDNAICSQGICKTCGDGFKRLRLPSGEGVCAVEVNSASELVEVYNYYSIRTDTPEQFTVLINSDINMYDIARNGAISPIGDTTNPWRFNIYSEGKRIYANKVGTRVHVSSNNTECGLFYAIKNCTIEGLVIDLDVTCYGSRAGILAGSAENAILKNMEIRGHVMGMTPIEDSPAGIGCSTGGLIGHGEKVKIDSVHVHASVAGPGITGGLAGQLKGSRILNAGMEGSVSSADAASGGLAGLFSGGEDGSEMSNAYFLGNVSGKGETGGLAGYWEDGLLLRNSYAVCDLQSEIGLAGGLTGNFKGRLTDISNVYFWSPDGQNRWTGLYNNSEQYIYVSPSVPIGLIDAPESGNRQLKSGDFPLLELLNQGKEVIKGASAWSETDAIVEIISSQEYITLPKVENLTTIYR